MNKELKPRKYMVYSNQMQISTNFVELCAATKDMMEMKSDNRKSDYAGISALPDEWPCSNSEEIF